MMLPLIWGPEQFRAYLNVFHNINLDEYLDPFFNQDLIIMSPHTAMMAKSDVDGDLAPSMVLNEEGQKLAKTFVNKTTPPQELEWLANYAKGEYKSDLKLKIDGKHIYQLYTISNKFDITGNKAFNYPQFLLNSTIAKGNIGSATIDCWIIKLLFQCYNAMFDKNKGRILDANGKQIARMRFKLTPTESNYLAHVYTRLVQERVVEGIKHQTGGSTAFQIYFLREITESKNIELVKQQLEHDFHVPVTMITKLLEVIEYCNYDNSLLTACQNFISKYNKGKLPKVPEPLLYWEDFIQESTYFGSLVKDLFDINIRIKELDQDRLGFTINSVLSDSGMDLLSSKDNSVVSVQENTDSDPFAGLGF